MYILNFQNLKDLRFSFSISPNVKTSLFISYTIYVKHIFWTYIYIYFFHILFFVFFFFWKISAIFLRFFYQLFFVIFITEWVHICEYSFVFALYILFLSFTKTDTHTQTHTHTHIYIYHKFNKKNHSQTIPSSILGAVIARVRKRFYLLTSKPATITHITQRASPPIPPSGELYMRIFTMKPHPQREGRNTPSILLILKIIQR